MDMQVNNTAASDSEVLQLVGFHVGEEEFCLDILCVQEIIRTQQMTRVPNLPDYIEGVINLRGKVIPVVCLRRCMGLENQASGQKTRIVVVDVHGQILGFVVDSVSEVLRINTDTVEPSPKLGKVERDYISGVGKMDSRLLLLLDLEKLMTDEEVKLGVTIH
jgi:purine-binding chemotaxis protein CheW